MTNNSEKIKTLLNYLDNDDDYESKYPYFVFSYLLNSDPIDDNNDIYALVIPLGAFKTVKKAKEHITKLSKNSNYEYFVLTTYGKINILRKEIQYENLLVEKNSNDNFNMQKVKLDEINKEQIKLKQRLAEIEQEKIELTNIIDKLSIIDLSSLK